MFTLLDCRKSTGEVHLITMYNHFKNLREDIQLLYLIPFQSHDNNQTQTQRHNQLQLQDSEITLAL